MSDEETKDKATVNRAKPSQSSPSQSSPSQSSRGAGAYRHTITVGRVEQGNADRRTDNQIRCQRQDDCDHGSVEEELSVAKKAAKKAAPKKAAGKKATKKAAKK